MSNQINHTLSDGDNYQKVPTPAASVLLIRDTNNQLEVFMIKRSMKTNFGGAWVFPGGKIDNEDISNNYSKYSPQLDDCLASARLGIEKNGLSYWIACIRECFEESSIVIQENDMIFVDKSPFKFGALTTFCASTDKTPHITVNPHSGILEHSGYEWVTKDQFCSNCLEYLIGPVEHFYSAHSEAYNV